MIVDNNYQKIVSYKPVCYTILNKWGTTWRGPKWIEKFLRKYRWICDDLPILEKIITFQNLKSKQLLHKILEEIYALESIVFSEKPKTLIIGEDEWLGLTNNIGNLNGVLEYHIKDSGVHNDFEPYKIYGLNVKVIPWMSGWVII